MPSLLDLYCLGAAKGYHDAGFGSSASNASEAYPYEFVRRTPSLATHGREFDAIHVPEGILAHDAESPWFKGREYPSLPTLLERSDRPYVLENGGLGRDGRHRRGLEEHGLQAGGSAATMFRSPVLPAAALCRMALASPAPQEAWS